MYRPDKMNAQQRIFVNDYELPASPASSPSDAPRKYYPPASGNRTSHSKIPDSDCNSRADRGRGGNDDWYPEYSNSRGRYDAASAYLHMPAPPSIPLPPKLNDHSSQRSQSCMDSLPNHVNDGRDRSSWNPPPPEDAGQRPRTPDSYGPRDHFPRAKTPDRVRGDRTRTPDRSRKRGTSTERAERRARSRSPEDAPAGRHSEAGRSSKAPAKSESRSGTRPAAAHPDSPDGRDLESIYLDSRSLTKQHQQREDQHGEEEEDGEAETSFTNGDKKEGGGGEKGGKRKEYDRPQYRKHNGTVGEDVYQNHGYEDEDRPVRTRAYSDSEAENFVEPPHYRFVDFNHPSRIKPSKSDRHAVSRKPPPSAATQSAGHGKADSMPDRYYKIPYRIPYYTRQPENNADYDYDVAAAANSSKPNRNGSLQPPFQPRGGSRGNSRNSFRPYPAPYAHYPPHSTYQSETTENDYYTPTDPVVVPSGKKPKHKRSHSDSSSSRTLTSPWNNDCNKIVTPKSEEESQMERFADFSGDVTLNYLRFIWNSPEVLRQIIWGSLFIGFFVYSFYCCWRSFATYLDKPTATQYNMYFEPNKILTFPTITICNMNPHNSSYLDRKENRAMKAYLYDKESKKLSWLGSIRSDPNEERSFNVKNYYRNSGQKLTDFIEDVKFKEEPLEVTEAFQERFTTHGLCWTFNADGRRTVNRTGMDFGLSFGININQDIYPKFVTKAGVKIMFHNTYEPALIDEYGMALTPGTENFISLSHERNKNLKAQTNGCRDEPLRLYDTYSVSGCERQCFTDIMLEECGCRSYYLKGNSDSEECRLYAEKNCVKEVVERYHSGFYSSRPQCICPDPCTSASYIATLSTAEYPAKSYGEALQQYNAQTATQGEGDGEPRDVQYYRENFLQVHIYFEILSIKEVEKVFSYKWSNLMGDVGGQLGLFLGANIVTIFEFVDFFARLFWYNCIMKIFLYYSNKKKKKKNTNMNHRP